MEIPNKKWKKLDTDLPSPEAKALEASVKSVVIGQDGVIEGLIYTWEISRANFRKSNLPVGVNLFLGPKGTGKTHTAKMFAKAERGSEDALHVIDCGQLSEPHSVADLVGSPPGYIGHKEPALLCQEKIDYPAGRPNSAASQKQKELAEAKKKLAELTDEVVKALEVRTFLRPEQRAQLNVSDSNMDMAIRRMLIERREIMNYVESLEQETPKQEERLEERPFSFVLFDEIEKAHKKVRDALLAAFQEGKMHMRDGTTTYFGKTQFFMTSNVGWESISELLYEKKKVIGLNRETVTKTKEETDRELYDRVMEAARKEFSPEFLDRCDRISVYRPLSDESISLIFDVELREFEEDHTRPMFVKLALGASVKELIVKEATDHPGSGARLLDKKISKYLRRPIARLKNRGELHMGDTVHILLDSSDPKEPKLEFFCEPADDLTPLLTEAGVGTDGELKPTLNENGDFISPDDTDTPKLDGGDDPAPGGGSPDSSGGGDDPDDYDGIPPGPKIRK